MKGTVLALTGCMLLVSAVSLVCQDTLGVRDSTVRPTNERLRGLSAAIMARNIRGYARSLGDSGFVDTVYTGQVDEQRLRMCISGICRYGPLAIIQPRTHVTDSSSTTRDSGAVIARIINKSNQPYLARTPRGDTVYKFNLHARDTVYWWAGRKGDAFVSIFVSSKPGVAPIISDLQPDEHPPGYWKQPLARWLWVESDEGAWATCDGGACCRSKGVPAAAGSQ